MPFILRVDIDKPYGHHNFWVKAMSKLREDYFFPSMNSLGYSKPIETLMKFCIQHNIAAILYFRNCTLPNNRVRALLKQGNFTLGFHAENTRTKETFIEELNAFEHKMQAKVTYITKHGSGSLKLGKHHYAPYEPEKYMQWANELQFDFSFGNGIASSLTELLPKENFYKNMFWLERNYRAESLDQLEPVVEFAQINTVPLLVHPANFFTNKDVRKDLETLVHLAKQRSIAWLHTIDN